MVSVSGTLAPGRHLHRRVVDRLPSTNTSDLEQRSQILLLHPSNVLTHPKGLMMLI